MLQKRIGKRKGGTLVFMLGIVFVIIIFAMFFLEMHKIWNYQYSIESRAQRAVNAAVEYAMDDKYRSDGYNYMDINKAKSVIYKYLKDDLALDSESSSGGTRKSSFGQKLYSIKYDSISYYDGRTSGAGIILKMTVTMYSNMSLKYGGGGTFTWESTISSTNFRVDENQRAGAGR